MVANDIAAPAAMHHIPTYEPPAAVVPSVDPIPGEVRQLLHGLASEWSDVPDRRALEVVPLKGAASNQVFQIKWMTNGGGKRARTVLVRIYGGAGEFFDRELEIRTFEELSRLGQGPMLLASFPNGRVEEFIHARTMSASDVRDPEISAIIATKLREFHELDMPGPKKVLQWDRLRNWLKVAQSVCSPEEAEEFSLNMMGDEISRLEDELSRDDQRVGFCHNDLQHANIMIDDETKLVTFIDFEFAGYNPVAYDIANHFCEMAGDNHSETPHILDYSKYPDVEERRRFVQIYLRSSGESPVDMEVDDLLQDIDKYVLACHLCLGLYAIILGHVSDTDFNCMEFTRQRLQQYWLLRKFYSMSF